MCELRIEVPVGAHLPHMTIILFEKEGGKMIGVQPEYELCVEGDTMQEVITVIAEKMGEMVESEPDVKMTRPCGMQFYSVPAPMLPEDYDEVHQENREELSEMAGAELPEDPTKVFYASVRPRLRGANHE